jgi:class 3 adenylate cyclase
MFCDLVGSTSLASKLDAEDWRNLVNAYLDEATKAVAGLGGYVLKRLGDGLMALFGYPQAQENDAERAADVKQFCADVKPGEGAIADCMKSHAADISDDCKEALAKAEAGNK